MKFYALSVLAMVLSGVAAQAQTNSGSISVSLPRCTPLLGYANWCTGEKTDGTQTIYTMSIQTTSRTIAISSDQSFSNLDPQKISSGMKHFSEEDGYSASEIAHVIGPVRDMINDGSKSDAQIAEYIASWMARVGAAN